MWGYRRGWLSAQLQATTSTDNTDSWSAGPSVQGQGVQWLLITPAWLRACLPEMQSKELTTHFKCCFPVFFPSHITASLRSNVSLF